MKHRRSPKLTRARCLIPVTWVALAGCQGLATSQFVVLQPPALVISEHEPGGLQESAPSQRPGKPGPTPSRLAQPTSLSLSAEKASSAAPGLPRQAAQAKTLLLKAHDSLVVKDHDSAVRYLKSYLDIYPDAALIRLQIAELCFRQLLPDEARRHFRQALGEVTDPVLPVHCRLHAHSRLMEIASSQSDRFNEELQRGIGLTLLAEHRQQESPTQEGASAQELYGKARLALQRAARLAPHDARPALYLVSVWNGMQQTRNALLALEQARYQSLGSALTPYDQLRMAQWSLELNPIQRTSLKR